MRGTFDVWSSNLSPMVDKMVGSAFLTVKTVADNIQSILYVATNIQAIITVAQQYTALGGDMSLITTVNSVLRSLDGAAMNALPIAVNRQETLLAFDNTGQPIVVTRSIPQMEALTVTDTNVLTGLTKTWSGEWAVLYIAGVAYPITAPAPAFSITTGTVVNWIPTNVSGLALSAGTPVSIFYSATQTN